MDSRTAGLLQKKAAKWYLDKIGEKPSLSNMVSVDQVMKGRRGVVTPILGQIFHYVYDPKTKDDLPYYDTFPLVMPIQMYDDGWLGINVHYLPPYLRARLLGLIRATMRSTKMTREVKARLTYQIIVTASRMRIALPAVKRYLTSHVASKIARIHPRDWHYVVMLPSEQFKKASKEKVWADSVAQIRGRKKS